MAIRSVVTISLPPSLTKRVDELAALKGLSRSKVIENFILESIDQEKMAVTAFGNPTVAAALMKAFADPVVMKALVGTMRQDLGDKQLDLFAKAMNQAMPSIAQVANRTLHPEKKKGGKK